MLIAVGAHEGIRLPIPGANLDGVLINTHFLRDVRLGKYTDRMKDEHLNQPSGLHPPAWETCPGVGRRECSHRCRPQRGAPGLQGIHGLPGKPGSNALLIPGKLRLPRKKASPSIHPVPSSASFRTETGHVCGVECMQVSEFPFDETGRLNVDKEPGSNHVIRLRHGHLFSRAACWSGFYPR